MSDASLKAPHPGAPGAQRAQRPALGLGSGLDLSIGELSPAGSSTRGLESAPSDTRRNKAAWPGSVLQFSDRTPQEKFTCAICLLLTETNCYIGIKIFLQSFFILTCPGKQYGYIQSI